MNFPVPNFYDPQNARALAVGAASAYDGQCPGGSREIVRAGTRVVISESGPNDLVVSFRGSADVQNWLTDFDCERSPLVWSPGKVHRGFSIVLAALAEELDAAIDPADGRRLWVTGHSLGGALAMLFALRCAVRRKMDVAGVYTFGQPRVGNGAFALGYETLLKACTFRVVHAEDAVPRLPWLLGSYRHAGHEIFYDERGAMFVDRPWLTRLAEDALALFSDQLTLISDHHVNHYVELLSHPVSRP